MFLLSSDAIFVTVCHKDNKRDLIMGFQSERKMADNHPVLYLLPLINTVPSPPLPKVPQPPPP